MHEYVVMSLNLLTDSAPKWIYPSFSHRSKAIHQMIHTYDPDIIGLQELTKNMFPHFKESFQTYGIFGDSRHSLIGDEYCSILYKKDQFELLGGKTLWLSSTPEIQSSKFKKSQFPRIVTYAYLKDKRNDHIFTVFNTHLDANLRSVRSLQAEVLSSIILEKEKGDFTILTGDFNSTSREDALSILAKTSMKDLVSDTIGSTLRGQIGSMRMHQLPIDHIFVTRNIMASNVKKITESDAGVHPTDHYPVIAYLNL